MAYPSIISAISNPQPTDRLNSPSHSSIHQAENTAITEIETFVGTISSVPGTLIYDIRSPNSNGGGHVQTANKGGTGQTSYNKGDVLVGSSSSVLTKLAIGTDGNALVADSTQASGVKWGLPGSTPIVKVFAASSVYTISSNITYVVIEGVGGGGGATGNAGAGAGGYARSIIAASSITSSIQVNVGVGGQSSIAGSITTFASIITCRGGIGTNNNTGGAGSSADFGMIKIQGGSGGNGNTNVPAYGGPSYFGGAGAPGAGGRSGNGGNDGIVIVTEY